MSFPLPPRDIASPACLSNFKVRSFGITINGDFFIFTVLPRLYKHLTEDFHEILSETTLLGHLVRFV